MRPELGRTQYLGEDVLEAAGVVEGVEVDVLFGCGGLYLEGDRRACRVGEAQDLGDFVGEGAYSQRNVSHVVASRTGYLASSRWRDGVDVRLKPSSAGESSTDMVWLVVGKSVVRHVWWVVGGRSVGCVVCGRPGGCCCTAVWQLVRASEQAEGQRVLEWAWAW